jgi:hypothetical protein
MQALVETVQGNSQQFHKQADIAQTNDWV